MINPRTFQLAAGQHTVVFSGRELNTYLDRIVITDDPNYVPGAVTASALVERNSEPTNAIIRSITAASGGVRIRFSSPAGASYKVEISHDLRTWHDLQPQPTINETNGLFEFLDTETTAPTRKFYRIRQD
jgi:hypothetical protein